MRETVEDNVCRLLATGSIAVLEIAPSRVEARVMGDHGTYEVTFEDRFRCTCPAIGPCSHATAVARVVRPLM